MAQTRSLFVRNDAAKRENFCLLCPKIRGRVSEFFCRIAQLAPDVFTNVRSSDQRLQRYDKNDFFDAI